MTSIIKMCPISGGLSVTPHCYVLKIDQSTFLLDCGWNSNFNTNFLDTLKPYINDIDAVLISYPDLEHLGALPYVMNKLGLFCSIYATVPVYKMGQMFMYDLYQARRNIDDFDLFNLDDVDAAFERFIQVKYNQTIYLKGKGEGIAITPLPAGHMIGGTAWKIVKDGEEDIIYAVDFNHKKERHLNGCEIEKIQRCSLLITDALNINYNQLRRRSRDEKLMTTILQTLRNNGNVLIAVDTAGRVIELAHMLDNLWQNRDSGLLAYSFALLNNVSYNVVEFAKSQIEWMSVKLLRGFEGHRNNPFQFKHLKLCHSLTEFNKVPSPKVVLASLPDLECGFSRDLFLLWCNNPKNAIILTSRPSEGTIGHDLITNGSNRTITLNIKKRVQLSGNDLEEYRHNKAAEKEAALNRKKTVDETEENDDDSSDEEVVPSGLGSGIVSHPNVKHDFIAKVPNRENEAKLHVGFFKSIKSKYLMYPYHEEKIRWDDYGEFVRPEDWMDDTETVDKQVSANESGVPTAVIESIKPVSQEENLDSQEIPSKCVSNVQLVDLKAQIMLIDFEGRSDGESTMKLIQNVKPRRIIIVRGTPENCRTLADFCRCHVMDQISNECENAVKPKSNVYTPVNGEMVDVTIESFIYQVRVTDSLLSRLVFSKGKDGLLAWVDGVIRCNVPRSIDMIEPQIIHSVPTLEHLDDENIKGHAFSFINELKLSDFKMVLTKNGFSSEFQGGVLFCGSGNVALRRHDSGRVTIEGCVGEDYYAIRELLYQQYAIM